MRRVLFFLILFPPLLYCKEFTWAHSQIMGSLSRGESLTHNLGMRPFAFFHPPQGWAISDPSCYAPSVRICFIPKKKRGVTPSINLAVETDVSSLEEYLSIVRSLHLSAPSKRWRKLPPITAHGMEGALTEIDTLADGKPLRMLQCIFVQNKTAYILTAAALKEEIPLYYKLFLESFISFTISENLLDSIPDKTRQQYLKEQLVNIKTRREESGFEKNVWKPFERRFVKEFSDMGSYWQILVLTEEKERL